MARTRVHLADLLRRRNGRPLMLLALAMVLAAGFVVRALMLNAWSLVREEQVLDCPFAGTAAHHHTDACYDADGNLVCPLPERSLHTHTDACYEDRLVLVCDNPAHKHTAACYDTVRALVCGQDELTEEHVHGPGCFRSALVCETDAPIAAVADADGNLRFAGAIDDGQGASALEIRAQAPAGVLPEGATMTLRAVADKDAEAALTHSLAADQLGAHHTLSSVDISFQDADGNEIEPAGEVTVTLSASFIRQHDKLAVVHVGDDGQVQVVGTVDDSDSSQGQLSFTARQFSAYCIVSLDDASDPDASDEVADTGAQTRTLTAGDGSSYRITLTCPPEANIPANATLEVSELREASRAYVTYLDRMSDALPDEGEVTYARLFDLTIVADGEKIQPDAPVDVRVDLLDNGRTEVEDRDSEVTVAHFADDKPRDPDGVDAQVSEAAAQSSVSFEADSFSIYAIVVTRIERSVLAADGNTYRITVSHTADANIPAGTELEVHEVADSSRAYERYLAQAAEALGDTVEPTYARFFDIDLVKDGHTVQPAVPVSVTVELADAPHKDTDADTLALHFGADEVEVLDATTATPEVFASAVSFEATGFSVYAIVEVQDTSTPAAAFAGDDPDGQTLFISNKRSRTEYYLLPSIKSEGWLNQTGDSGAAQAFTFTKVDDGLYTVSCVDADGTTRYLTLDSANLTMGTEPYAFKLTKKNGYWLFQMGDGSNNYVNHNDDKGFGRWRDGYNDAGNRLILTVPPLAPEDPFGLDGRTLGIMNYKNGLFGTGMLAEVTSNKRMAAKELLVRNNPLSKGSSLFVAQDSGLGAWTFSYVGDKGYYLRSEDGRYLTISGASVTLEDEPTAYSVISIEQGTGTYAGKVRFTNKDGQAINLYSGSASNGFGGYNDRKENEWHNLVQISSFDESDFTVYTANKVSISDADKVPNGAQVVVYTRVWNDATKAYEFYAVDYDGELVRVYESGNTLQWVGLKINTMLWDFTEYYYEGTTNPNYYYDLRNSYSKQYLAPQIKGGQVLSDSPIGLNLTGRRYSDYYSSILAWDDPYYDYAGLTVADGSLTSGPMAQADDFYVAIIEPVAGELTTVKTVDNATYGITMTMTDYNGKVNNNGREETQTSVMGSKSTVYTGTTKSRTGLVSTGLADDGYPTATETGKSLSSLFAQGQAVNHLFLKNTYEESGYFEYNCTENFAHLGDDGNFVVYDQIGTIDASGTSLDHGQFLPYNDLDPAKIAVTYTNQTNELDESLPGTDPRKGEQLYGIAKADTDYYFGMEMGAHFMQSADGLDDWGHDIIFEFAGDDDMWLYVDGQLVLDLGGVHKASVGTINFRTGEINQCGTKTTLRAAFESAYRAQHSDCTDAEVAAYLDGIFVQKTVDGKSCYVFKDYSSHDMKMLYMERGAGASNLHMRFNLATTEEGVVELAKRVSGTDKQDYASVAFPYQIWYRDHDQSFKLLTQQAEDLHGYTVTYKGTKEPVTYEESAGGYDSVFYLKPGQRADVHLPSEDTEYYVVECGVKTSLYDVVSANDVRLTGTAAAKGAKDYAIDKALVAERKRVTYDNHVDPSALRTLTIKKRLFDERDQELSATDDPTGFRFRMYLGEALDYYRLDSYYVKDPSGNYCSYQNGAFVSLGVSDFSKLTAEQLKTATFTTSASGAIDKIPAGYSAEIRNILVDTPFKVEEREADLPAGYAFKEYKRVEGSYITGDGTNEGTIRENSDPAIEVHNRRGWGLTVKKSWSDASFMHAHDPVYVAVYAGNKLVEGSVRELAAPATSVYYFFDALEDGYGFDDYTVREVALRGAEVADDGTVTYSAIEPVDEGKTIEVGGTPRGGEHEDAFTYTVSYEPGEASGVTGNVRTDKVANSRPGIRVVKCDFAGNPLAGATFTLVDAAGEPVGAGSFTSAAGGAVTTAYLKAGSYTLAETVAPQGYQGMREPLAITVADDNSVEVSGGDEGLWSFDESDVDNPVITIKNRPLSLEVVKIDAGTGEPLPGVRFALYPQAMGTDGQPRKDYRPVAGLEGVTTGEDGLLAGVDQTLDAGTYYLSELDAPSGYKKLSEDVVFTLHDNGVVTLDAGGDADWLSETVADDGTVAYRLTVPNGFGKLKLSFVKVDTSNTAVTLPGAVFDLYRVEDGERTLVQEGLTSNDEGLLALGDVTTFRIAPGSYELEETAAPDGYLLPENPVSLTVSTTGVSYDDGYVLSQNGNGVSGTMSDGFVLLLSNTAGAELPASGGQGPAATVACGLAVLALGAAARVLRRLAERSAR